MAATVTMNYINQKFTESLINSTIARAEQQAAFTPTMTAVPFAKGFMSEIRDIIKIINNASNREDVLAAYDEYITIGLRANAPLHTILAGICANLGINEKFKINIKEALMGILKANHIVGSVDVKVEEKKTESKPEKITDKSQEAVEELPPEANPKNKNDVVIDVPAEEIKMIEEEEEPAETTDKKNNKQPASVETKKDSDKEAKQKPVKEKKEQKSSTQPPMVTEQHSAAKNIGLDINKFIKPDNQEQSMPVWPVANPENQAHPMPFFTGTRPDTPVPWELRGTQYVNPAELRVIQPAPAPQQQTVQPSAQGAPVSTPQQPVGVQTAQQSVGEEIEEPEDINALVKEMQKYFVLIKGTHPGFTIDQIKKLLEMRKWPYTKVQLKKLGCKGTPNTVKYVEVPMETYADEEERKMFDMCFRVTAKDKKNPIIVLIDTQEKQLPGAPAKTNALCIRKQK